MAGTKIRGITIELGADTSGLTKALKSVNTEIGQTQKGLKDVERLLKLDPKNTELLEQKQRLLGERIDQTKTKLQALEEAQKQVGEELQKTGKGQEQYDALTREIASCTLELQTLEKQASKSQQALEKIAAAGEKIKDAGGKIESVGKNLKYVSAVAAGALTGIVKTTADFDAAMSKVAAISGAAGEDFDSLRGKAREMGATTKFTATEAAEAMNYMAMAGWKTDQMLSGVAGIMNLAAASGEELATTSDIVTDALTAFGMKAEDSAHFADILAAAASNANTNVAMMGESFKYAAPVAGSLGYSAEDVALALGLMANSGIKASMAGTSLRNMFQRMAKPTKESAAAMARLGLSIDDGKGNMYSFREIMDQLREGFVEINMPIEEYDRRVAQLDEDLEEGRIKQKAYNKEIEELNLQAFGAAGAEKARAAAMLGGTRAMSGLLAIANATEEDYNKLAAAIDNSSQAFAKTTDGIIPLNEALASGAEILETYDGSAAAMAATMQDNASGQMEILKSQVQELAISLGDTLTPAITDLIAKAQGFVDMLNAMDDETKKNAVNALILAACLSPVLIIIGKLTTAIGTLVTWGAKFGSFLSTAAGGVAIVAAAIVSFAALLAANVAAFALKLDEMKAAWDTTVDHVYEKIAGLGTKFSEGLEFMSNTLQAWFEGVAGVIRAFMDLAGGLFQALGALVTGKWSEMWDGCKQVLFSFLDAVTAILRTVANTVLGIINDIITGINKLFDVDIGKIPFLSDSSIVREWKNMKKVPTIVVNSQMAEGGTISNGSALVGEAGAEILTVSNGSATVTPLGGSNGQTDLVGLLETYLPYLASGNTLVMDSGALVGSIAPDMNAALGSIAIRGGHR